VIGVAQDVYDLYLAKQVQQWTHGLDPYVAMAQWNAEEGSSGNWPGHNPAGIRPGNTAVDALANGVNQAGFDTFTNDITGAQAYATLINTDKNYAGIRQSIKAGTPQAELAAIAASPWDTGHYGGSGQNLFASYASVTGNKVTDPLAPASTGAQTSSGGQSSSTGATLPKNALEYALLGIGGVILLTALL